MNISCTQTQVSIHIPTPTNKKPTVYPHFVCMYVAILIVFIATSIAFNIYRLSYSSIIIYIVCTMAITVYTTNIRPLSLVIGSLPLINPEPELPLTSDLGCIFVVSNFQFSGHCCEEMDGWEMAWEV